jgi:hypothetical protein
VLCDPCWEPLRDRLWVVPGFASVWGKCQGCGEWESVRVLRDAKPGGGKGAMVGTCVNCAGG